MTKKIALIGFGAVGKTYSDVYPLTAIVEPEPKDLQDIQKRGTYYPSLNEMLAQPELPDAVIICTPPNTHAKIAEACLKKGMDCLIEKPLTTNLEEGKKLLNIAREHGKKIVEAAKYQNTEPLLEIKKRIERGEIGKLKEIKCIFTGHLEAKGNWRSNSSISGGGVWMDNGPHAIAVVETLLGKAQSVQIVKCEYAQETNVEDEIEAEIHHEKGFTSSIVLSWNRHLPVPYVVAKGEKGELIADWNETLLSVEGMREVVSGGYDKRKSFKRVVDDFISGETDKDPLHTLKCVLAGYRSMKSGEWESIE